MTCMRYRLLVSEIYVLEFNALAGQMTTSINRADVTTSPCISGRDGRSNEPTTPSYKDSSQSLRTIYWYVPTAVRIRRC